MSGRAHRQDLRGLSTSVPAGGVKRAVVTDAVPDGGDKNGVIDYKAIYTAQHDAERKRAGKPRPGDSGSDILDYQKPYEQDSQKRGR